MVHPVYQQVLFKFRSHIVNVEKFYEVSATMNYGEDAYLHGLEQPTEKKNLCLGAML